MPISYTEALTIVTSVAEDNVPRYKHDTDKVPASKALGRVLAVDLVSLTATPPFDTSAMDGYALSSTMTASASPSHPVSFRCVGSIAAGDRPLTVSAEYVDESGIPPCVEIMTGARFPRSGAGVSELDACIPVEHVTLRRDLGRTEGQYIEVVGPVRAMQHRRLAGSDFRASDIVRKAGEAVRLQDLMTMASLGVDSARVLRRINVGIWSTGAEVASSGSNILNGDGDAQIRDANGPFLTETMKHLGVDVQFLGILHDDVAKTAAAISAVTGSQDFDVLITTGGVSAGKFDHVREAVESIGACIQFHKVAMRPGHPVLFATLPRTAPAPSNGVDSATSCCERLGAAFFGLPGNPVATAICLRMLVVPYLQQLGCLPPESSILARVVTAPVSSSTTNGHACKGSDIVMKIPVHSDVFRHGQLQVRDNSLEVEINPEQGSSGLRSFAQSNCWVHVPKGHGDLKAGELMRCLSLIPGQALL